MAKISDSSLENKIKYNNSDEFTDNTNSKMNTK